MNSRRTRRLVRALRRLEPLFWLAVVGLIAYGIAIAIRDCGGP